MKKWIESNVTLQLRKGHHFCLYGCIHLIAVFQWELLCSWLPVRVRIKRPFCLFTTNDAGYRYFLNLSTLHSLTVITIYFYLDYAAHAFASILKQKKKKRKKSILHACFGIKHSCLFLFGLGSFFHRGVGRAELTSLV